MKRKPAIGTMDLLELLAEQEEEAPPLCRHAASVRAWSRDHDENSPYYGSWVHAEPHCLRPAHRKDLP